MAIGTGSAALKIKIAPSLPPKVVSLDSSLLDDSGRKTRTAKEDKSAALDIAARHMRSINSSKTDGCMIS